MNRHCFPTTLILTSAVLLTGCQHSNVTALAAESAPKHLASVTAVRSKTPSSETSEKKTASSAFAISESVYTSHKISKQDYAYIYGGLKAKSFSTRDAIGALSAFETAKNLTQAQKHQAGDLLVSMLSKPYPNDSSENVKPIVITVLGVIGDKHAVPHLVPLLKSPEDTTRIAAQGALKDLGYKVPPLQSLLY